MKRKMSFKVIVKEIEMRMVTLILTLLLLLCCGCSSKTIEPQQRIVRVTAGTLQGSGVLYEKNENYFVVVTAAHVLAQEKEKITVTFYDDFDVESESCYISTSADIAFVYVPLESIPKSHLKNYQAVQMDKQAFDAIESGTEVWFWSDGTDMVTQEMSALQNANMEEQEGRYRGMVLENWIFVEDFGQYMMLLQGQITPGMSGGGVFDGEDNFLGILCGANEKGEVAAVPLNIVQAEYAGVY